MTISADILANAPTLYWKLDDASGPAASDSSGHSHPGAYGGPFTLHQPGPEAGTFAAQFAASGQVLCTGFPQVSAAPWSVSFYFSVNAIATPPSADLFTFGARASNRGVFVSLNNATAFTSAAYSSAGTGLQTGAMTPGQPLKFWHAYALTYAGSGVVTPYLDGVAGTPSATLTLGSILSTDNFGIVAPYGAVIAHLAWFDHQLTAAQVATIHGYRYDWPFGPMVNMAYPVVPGAGGTGNLNPSDPVVVGIDTDLSDIRKAVIHDYTTGAPP